MSTVTTVTITAQAGGATANWQLLLTPSPAPDSLALDPVETANGSRGVVRIPLSAMAGHDQLLRLTSSNPAVASVPEFMTMPASTEGGVFFVETSAVTARTVVTISVTGGGVTRSATLTVNPAPPAAPTLQSPGNQATGVAQPVAFNWTDVANAVSYEIQIDNNSTMSAPFIANQNVSTSQASIGSLPAQQLWWRVRARNAAGAFGPFSPTRRFTPAASIMPNPGDTGVPR